MSRTAISKWESGRGYPNLDSLKDIAKFFSIIIDELAKLSSQTDEKMSAGVIASIVVGATVVAGTGGFSLFWFVIKKKKWSDLIVVLKKKWVSLIAIFKK